MSPHEFAIELPHITLAAQGWGDPALPPGGLRGVDTVLGSVEGIKRLIEIAPSPYHGLNFCQGTVAEMLQDPKNEVPEIIRYFGEREKIFMVHFRNIRGGYLNFEEVFPDEGDVDMYSVIRELVAVMQSRKASIPMRPDHGHQMLDDLKKKTNPGYSAIGRLRGLAELRGLELGIVRGL